jgi:uncharacterized small protein (DUF1192 family)
MADYTAEQLYKIIDDAIGRRLDGMSLVDISECREELKATRYALIDMEQKFNVWHKIAQAYSDKNAALLAQIEEMQNKIVHLTTEIVRLKSALKSKDVWGG